ncbi:MAG: NAD(P)H-hydrate epimerase [Candidatus Omnitrophica bacterium]|nr:NAD(P)H-hydrate epimerase [Candidatus Omnitrophota bacterium]
MKGLELNKIRELEARAKELGLEERILIENASSNLFKTIEGLNLGKRVLVISGRGNNGADVLSCARKLFSAGYSVATVVLEDKELGPEAAFQRDLLAKIGCQLYSLGSDNILKLKELFRDSDFILEGILGIGVKGEISPFFRKTIELINESGKKIVSCDIPSGLSPDQGVVSGQAVKADYTVSFIAPKLGFYLNQGPNLCGEIFVVDIGISRNILEKVSGAREGT